MAADRVITCTNQDGDSLTFTEKGFTPFLLCSVEGVYDSANEVSITENTMMDGGVFQSSIAKYRNIVITVKDRAITKSKIGESGEIVIYSAIIKGKTLEIIDADNPDIETVGSKDFIYHRELLDRVFKPKELGRLTFKEDKEERVIDYYVEYIKSTGTHTSRIHTISLICPDPFFYEPNDAVVRLSQIVASFKFLHEFTSDGEELGYSMGGYENIYNSSGNENIGLTINITGDSDIINPFITRMESGEYIKIGNNINPFTLSTGDSLIITTGEGNKHIYLVHNGETSEINYLMADGSSFIQLMRGNNNINFNADSGRNSMVVEISYRLQYARA